MNRMELNKTSDNYICTIQIKKELYKDIIFSSILFILIYSFMIIIVHKTPLFDYINLFDWKIAIQMFLLCQLIEIIFNSNKKNSNFKIKVYHPIYGIILYAIIGILAYFIHLVISGATFHWDWLIYTTISIILLAHIVLILIKLNFGNKIKE
jgi:hypothetical protein